MLQMACAVRAVVEASYIYTLHIHFPYLTVNSAYLRQTVCTLQVILYVLSTGIFSFCVCVLGEGRGLRVCV